MPSPARLGSDLRALCSRAALQPVNRPLLGIARATPLLHRQYDYSNFTPPSQAKNAENPVKRSVVERLPLRGVKTLRTKATHVNKRTTRACLGGRANTFYIRNSAPQEAQVFLVDFCSRPQTGQVKLESPRFTENTLFPCLMKDFTADKAPWPSVP